jgi:hypothetical protein
MQFTETNARREPKIGGLMAVPEKDRVLRNQDAFRPIAAANYRLPRVNSVMRCDCRLEPLGFEVSANSPRNSHAEGRGGAGLFAQRPPVSFASGGL